MRDYLGCIFFPSATPLYATLCHIHATANSMLACICVYEDDVINQCFQYQPNSLPSFADSKYSSFRPRHHHECCSA